MPPLLADELFTKKKHFKFYSCSGHVFLTKTKVKFLLTNLSTKLYHAVNSKFSIKENNL